MADHHTASMALLTDRQQEVYEFIRDKIRSRGYGPTVREIGGEFGIASPNGVMCHLRALERKGLVSREPNLSRAITLSTEPPFQRGLPLAGRIAAGVLHEAVEQNEGIEFGERSDADDLLGLEGRGASMKEAKIAAATGPGSRASRCPMTIYAGSTTAEKRPKLAIALS